SSLYQNHPDWFLQEDGHPLSAGSNWSGYYALDFDNQEVRAYLKQVFDRIFNEWGFDLVKLDFLFAAAMKPTANETRAARMHRAMIYLRSLCKDHLILGCGVPLFPAFGLVDYCRIGPDMSLSWDDVWYMKPLHKERISSAHTIINTVVRHGIDGRAWRNDPDVFLLRKDNIKMNEKQKMDLARINAIYGGVFLTSDNPSLYTPEMQQQYQQLRQLSEAKIISLATDKDEITANLLVDGSPTVMNVSLKGR
ncbi:MAG: alpha-galactosidase, partial [Erysipelotrichaceae bacterium]|nr:alpha-galactosidase [Erysipelotrichaceae bacterium]